MNRNLYQVIGLIALVLIGVITFYYQGKAIHMLRDQIKTQHQQLESYKQEDEERLLVLAAKVEVIDQSTNAEGKRKIRIRKVRDAIKDMIQSFPDNKPELALQKTMSLLEMTEISTSVVDYCDEYSVPVYLMLGLIRQESAFNTKAVSKAGAQGITQVMPDTAEDIKGWLQRRTYNPWDARHNIQFGTYYLSKMLDRFRDYPDKFDLAVKAYNAGPAIVARWKAGEVDNLWPQTIEYSKAVLGYSKQFEKLGIR